MIDVAVIQHKITQNFLMAFAAFLLMVYARFTKNRMEKIMLIGLTGFALFNMLFVVGGKTGHVVIQILIVYFFVDWFKFIFDRSHRRLNLLLDECIAFCKPEQSKYWDTK